MHQIADVGATRLGLTLGMSTGGDQLAGLLRWYPAAWRERYGDELVALMQAVGDQQPSFRFKLSVARWPA